MFGATRLASAAVVNSPPASDFNEARSQSYKDTSDEAVILSYVRRYSSFEENGGLECILRSQVWDGHAHEKKADYIAAAGAVKMG